MRRLESVEQAVRASDATLFMVALGQRRAATPTSRAASSGSSISAAGARCSSSAAISSMDPFAEILEELANQYLIGYESTNPKRDGAWREIKLELPNHSYSVRARQGYRAPEK